MRVLEVNDIHDSTNPGVTTALNALVDALAESSEVDAEFHLACVGKAAWLPQSSVCFHEFPADSSKLGRSWRHSPGLTKALEAVARDQAIDLVHIHGVWGHPHMSAAAVAKKCGLPSVLTNHGMLTRWALAGPGRIGALKKRVYLRLVAQRAFDEVSVFHAITLEDRDDLARLFPGREIALIPNSIDLAQIDSALSEFERSPADDYFLFVGRLHPKKGIDLLIHAFQLAQVSRSWRLLIVGPEEDEEYVAQLKRDAAVGDKAGRIEFLGPVWSHSDKLSYMRNARVMVVPSRSEVVGLVNLEASACSTPTITTPETGLLDWCDGGGLLVSPEVADLKRALEQAASWSDSERLERGRRSRELIESTYSTAVTTRQWAQLYTSLVS